MNAGGSILAGLVLPERPEARPKTQPGPKIFEVYMRSNSDGSLVGFDPIGLFVEPGTVLRWVCESGVHTTAAYSPQNDNHALRIPENAQPWSSDYLMPGQRFEVTLIGEGVYDYFCVPHELAGMVGRISVGKATGPGSLPFDYFAGEGRSWREVPPAAQQAFPSIAEIMQKKVVVSPFKF